MRRSPRIGALAACALMVAACGAGGDTAGPSTGSGTTTAPTSAPVVSPALLDAGRYPTKPRPPLGLSGSAVVGATIDAQNLADFVMGPWQVDANLVTPYLDAFYVITTSSTLQQLGPQGVAEAAGRHGLINGFASARQVTDESAMINAVLRFPDAAAAAAASKDMGAAAVVTPIRGQTPTVLPIPDHPDAVASTYPFTSAGASRPRATVRSFTAHGPYVLMQFVQKVDGVDAATALVAKAIDTQVPLIDQFVPAGDLAAVPLDPTGLLAKTLPTETVSNAAKNAVYGTRGAQHFQSNPIGSQVLFKDTGITNVAMGATNVYRAKNEGAAVMITNSFSQEVSTNDSKPADSVAALPDSHCWALPKSFYCVAPAGQDAIEVQGKQLLDTQQQLAAQYVMLTAR